MRQSVLSVAVIFASAVTLQAAPIVTGVSPASGGAGTSVALVGTGLAGTTAVRFHGFPSGARQDAAFTPVNDTLVNAIVPFASTSWVVSLFHNDGVAVALPASTVSVPDALTGPGSRAYLVRSGGALTSSVGSSVVYVESGGTFSNNGGGSNLIFLENGATYISPGGGGSNELYYELDANLLIGNGSGISLSLVADLNYRVIPEPTAALLIAGAWAIVLRRRGVR